jgi:peptidoglycan hydrolase CwlO-like protein
MFKKLMIGGVVLGVVAFLVLGPALLSHAGQALSWARSKVEHSVPIEYELERAEALIDGILPEIEACKQVVAQEQVEIRYLEEESARLGKRQTEERGRIHVRNAALKDQAHEVLVAGRSWPRARIETDQVRALDAYKRNEALLESKRRLLEARRGSLEAAVARLSAVCSEKTSLEMTVEQLRAQLRQTQALEATTRSVALDDSNLGRAKELLERCRKRLDVAQQMLENDVGVTYPRLELDVPVSDITLEVDKYFQIEQAPVAEQTLALHALSAGGND